MQTSAVIGLGLIGGSFARAAKQAGRRVLGVDCCPQTREMALAAGAADDISDSIAAAGEAEEIFIAAPVGAFDDIFSALQKSLSPTAAVFDGGSCKRRAMESAAAMLGEQGRTVCAVPSDCGRRKQRLSRLLRRFVSRAQSGDVRGEGR